jgi:hypothetical protein
MPAAVQEDSPAPDGEELPEGAAEQAP